MYKKIITFSILFLLIISNYSIASFFSIPTWSDSETLEVNSNPSDLFSLESESAILIEQHSGQILYEKDIHKQLRPASVTKIMSLLLFMEALENNEISYDTPIPCSENASSMGGSQIWLASNETLTVDEMLKAISIVSANDCTVALAEYLCGTEEIFVQKMNEKAKELGMNDTTFKNCHGIDEDGHFTSAYDISIMSKELLNKYPEIKNYTTIWMDSLRNGSSELVNTNKLIRTYDGATGLKTGSTSLALYNLSASATRNDLSLIAVILKAPTPQIRFSESKLLLDYGFSNFESKKLCQKNILFKSVPISKGTQDTLNLLYEDDLVSIQKKNDKTEISEELLLSENLEAPINKGDIVGKINYYKGNSTIGSVNLIAESDLHKKTIFTSFLLIFKEWCSLEKS